MILSHAGMPKTTPPVGSPGAFRPQRKRLASVAKRAVDIIASLAGLALVAPIIAVAGAAISIFDGGPVFWKQGRTGVNGTIFTLWKLRTMSEATDTSGRLLEDDARLTRVGALLRAWSLDELPQLWNVLKGDMSLVGPRPLLPSYVPRYNQFQRRRHEVKPGITGWVQVNGRNALTWEEKFDLDVWYVDHCSLWLDIKILVLTLLKVLQRDGISQKGHATMPEFTGTVGITRQHE